MPYALPIRRLTSPLFAAALLASTASAALPLSTAPPSNQCAEGIPLRLGGALDDQILDAVRAADGDLLIGGYEAGQLGIENHWPSGDSRGFVELRAADGRLRWRHVIDTAGTDSVETISFTADGRIAVAGRTSGNLPGFAAAGQLDAFVALLDADGQRLGLLQFGDERPQHPMDLIELPSGDLMLGGYDDTYVSDHAVLDWENGFLARIQRDPQHGLTLSNWLRSSLPEPDRIYSLAVADPGSDDVILASQRETSPALGGGTQLVRISKLGKQRWLRSVSHHPADALTRLLADDKGRLFAAGSFLSALGGPSSGSSEAVLMQVDPDDGALRWARRIGHADPDWVTALALAPNGDLHMAGLATPIETIGLPQQLSYVFGARFSPRGRLLARWNSAPFDAGRIDPWVSVVPDGCHNQPWLALSLQGPLDPLPARGRLDGVLLRPDLLQ